VTQDIQLSEYIHFYCPVSVSWQQSMQNTMPVTKTRYHFRYHVRRRNQWSRLCLYCHYATWGL